MELFDSFLELVDEYAGFVAVIKALANLSIFYVSYINIQKLFWKKVELSCGSFKIRQKHFTVQNVTNVVSLKYYDGGLVLNEVRKEILKVTCPKIKEV
ncbi:MAG: hypothetical protein U0L74_02435 [Paludibacteraceae bacterium]|nr:hypothetical protein [Paludibacteraceae bacterium]